MKKIFLLLMFCVCYLYANVGNITAVSGDIFILRDNIQLKASLNDTVKKSDTIKSVGKSKAQIVFTDKTVVTIGKDSVLNIQEYLVDNALNSSVKLGMSMGLFRVMTGKISDIAPDKFVLQTKNATIGIRGTVFVGQTDKEMDKIACLNGIVIVESQGKSIDLLEGEIVYVLAGKIPSSPKKYKMGDIKSIDSFSNVDAEFKELAGDIVKTIDIGSKDLVDQNLENNFMTQIQEIQNINDRSATYNMYISSFYDEIYEQLSEKYFETNMKDFAVNQYQDLFDDSYTPLLFTYFSIYKPQSDDVNDVMEAIPFLAWRHEEYTQKTPESKIVEYMGGVNPLTQEIYPHWDGRATGRKVVAFSGNVIGQVSNESDLLKISLIDPQENYSTVTIDFGNRLFTSSFAFLAPDPITDEVQLTQYKISFVDELSLSTTGFNASGTSYTMQNGRFYGEDLNQISAAFLVDNLQNSNSAYGEFVANNIGEYDVEQVFMGEDESFSWGYWSSEYTGTLGGWVEPKIENTPVDVISDYIAQQQVHTYSGGVIGTFSRISEDLPTEPMSGSFYLDIDFGKETMEGFMLLQTYQDEFQIAVTQGELNEKGFSVSKYMQTSTKDIEELDMSGQFFGEDAQKIGGGVKFETVDGDIGLGAFIGTKGE